MEKTQLVHEMNLLEQENYENLNSEIGMENEKNEKAFF